MVGKKLHEVIKKSGLKMVEVANYMGISEQNLYKLFKKDSCETAYLKKASELLNVPITYFLYDDVTLDDIENLVVRDEEAIYKRKYEQLRNTLKNLTL